MVGALGRAVAAHRSQVGEPVRVVRAPGRVNLIGEHTDYNDGFALPMALPFDTVVAMSDEGDAVTGPVAISSSGFGEAVIDPTGDARRHHGWAQHVAGVVQLMAERGVPSGGWRATIDTDIPTGASLSSSAAIEVAVTIALLERAGVVWSAIDVARLGQEVENRIVGLPSGIMDQLISAGARAGHASLLDCRRLTLEPVPLPPGTSVVVMDTGTRRVLAEAAYAERRMSCERAAAALQVAALRDASPEGVAQIADDVDRRRARHIVSENERTLAAAEAMRAGDAIELGRLMSHSHRSLRDDFEVSGPALDAIVEVASPAPGCLGARLTGGGFAGCAVALVASDAVDAFNRTVQAHYRFDGHAAQLWVCSPAAGAAVVR
jgi:galactokinase